ncbi:hypothetical protein M9Y10_011421 [Tritrichomonas musculus]|uniref:Protein kinase domain-containing protein n=1 Tax=Tritrichomonas musculus TaxID=1915356 RepID=A0ABR2IJH8_9EUKA
MDRFSNIPEGTIYESPTGAHYSIRRKLGYGVSGHVYQAIEIETNKKVAFKIGYIPKDCKNPKDDQLLHEINMYEYIDQHIQQSEKQFFGELIDNFLIEEQHARVLILELYVINAFQQLKGWGYCGFSLEQVQIILRDVASGMKALHEIKVTHCDLKPENIVLTSNNHARIIDFGSSETLEDNFDLYIQSRYYRAPEVILELQKKSTVDVWSFGCIAFELYMGLPIFAGHNKLHMLQLMEVRLGKFPIRMIRDSTCSQNFFKNNKVVFYDKFFDPSHFKNTSLSDIILSKPTNQVKIRDSLLNLIEQCLRYEPEKRISFSSIIDHNFFSFC